MSVLFVSFFYFSTKLWVRKWFAYFCFPFGVLKYLLELLMSFHFYFFSIHYQTTLGTTNKWTTSNTNPRVT